LSAIVLVASAIVFLGIFALPKEQERRCRLNCLNNLHILYSGIYATGLERATRNGGFVWMEDVLTCMNPVTCPSDGQYVLPTTGGYPICTYHGNLLASEPAASRWPPLNYGAKWRAPNNATHGSSRPLAP
jgi:hypothetical protein